MSRQTFWGMFMDRRELLQFGAAAAATTAFAPKVSAQTPGVPAGWKNSLNAYSRTLHWLRTPEEVAEACHEIGNTTIDLTVRPYPGHVQPEKMKTDLPVWVNGLKRNGITVQMIGMDVVDVKTPYVEDMRSEEHKSELQSHSFISYAAFC